jgi:hypothetical protein
MHIECGPFDAAGPVRFDIDGRERGGGPAALGGTVTIHTIVVAPDNITLGLSRQIKKAGSLFIEVHEQGAETIKFGLSGYGAGLVRVQHSGAECSGRAILPSEWRRINGAASGNARTP